MDRDIQMLQRAIKAVREREKWVIDQCDCGQAHPANFHGDCRDDENRLCSLPYDILDGATEDECAACGITYDDERQELMRRAEEIEAG